MSIAQPQALADLQELLDAFGAGERPLCKRTFVAICVARNLSHDEAESLAIVARDQLELANAGSALQRQPSN